MGAYSSYRLAEIRRARVWFAHVPGWPYALSIRASNKSEARARLREFVGVARLPAGSAVWASEVS